MHMRCLFILTICWGSSASMILSDTLYVNSTNATDTSSLKSYSYYFVDSVLFDSIKIDLLQPADTLTLWFGYSVKRNALDTCYSPLDSVINLPTGKVAGRLVTMCPVPVINGIHFNGSSSYVMPLKDSISYPSYIHKLFVKDISNNDPYSSVILIKIAFYNQLGIRSFILKASPTSTRAQQSTSKLELSSVPQSAPIYTDISGRKARLSTKISRGLSIYKKHIYVNCR